MSQERFDIEVSGDSDQMQVAPFPLETRSALQQSKNLFGSEMAQSISKQTSGEEEKAAIPQEGGNDRRDGFEPFLTEPQPDNQRFINMYGGNYSQHMELNRLRAEELMRVGAFNGQIVLTSSSSLRRTSPDVNPDGSVTAKRGLFWGEQVQEEETARPYQVLPIPQGWRVEIRDQEILDYLAREQSTKPLDKRFVVQFNRNLRSAFFEILKKEKIGDRDPDFKWKIFLTLPPSIILSISVADGLTVEESFWITVFTALFYSNINLFGKDRLNSRAHTFRNLESPYEFFMPPVEFDRWVRGAAYLTLKARNLVRLHSQGSK